MESRKKKESSQVTFFSRYKIKKERDENFRSQETKKNCHTAKLTIINAVLTMNSRDLLIIIMLDRL